MSFDDELYNSRQPRNNKHRLDLTHCRLSWNDTSHRQRLMCISRTVNQCWHNSGDMITFLSTQWWLPTKLYTIHVNSQILTAFWNVWSFKQRKPRTVPKFIFELSLTLKLGPSFCHQQYRKEIPMASTHVWNLLTCVKYGSTHSRTKTGKLFYLHTCSGTICVQCVQCLLCMSRAHGY